MNDLTVGIAVGRLSTRGAAQIRVGAEWHDIRARVDLRDVKVIALPDLFLLLQAEEVRV